jgi:hypothetical protein
MVQSDWDVDPGLHNSHPPSTRATTLKPSLLPCSRRLHDYSTLSFFLSKTTKKKKKERKRKLSKRQPKPKHQAEEAPRLNDTQDAKLAQEMLDVAFNKGMTPGRHRRRPKDELSLASPPPTARQLAPPWRSRDPRQTTTPLAETRANRHRQCHHDTADTSPLEEGNSEHPAAPPRHRWSSAAQLQAAAPPRHSEHTTKTATNGRATTTPPPSKPTSSLR